MVGSDVLDGSGDIDGELVGSDVLDGSGVVVGEVVAVAIGGGVWVSSVGAITDGVGVPSVGMRGGSVIAG